MSTQTSERRLTRSQARLGAKPTDAGTPSAVTPSASKPPASRSRVKAGRRVLADIAGNDSPIIGLVPSMSSSCTGTPSSNLKSAWESCRSRMGQPGTEHHESMASSPAGSKTPVGESLLRSQVQLLLQKVDDSSYNHTKAPSLRSLCHLNGSFLISPSSLAAPTPMNTPATCDFASLSLPTPAMAFPAALTHPDLLPDVMTTSTQENRYEATIATGGMTGASYLQEPVLNLPAMVPQISHFKNDNANADGSGPKGCAAYTGHLAITESVICGRDQHQVMQISPLISEASTIDVDQGAEALFNLGQLTTRILHFESPDRADCVKTTTILSNVPGIDTIAASQLARELEDDEVSEWSVLVNVSSPLGKQDDVLQSEVVEGFPTPGPAVVAVPCSVHDHIQKNREESNKVDLLWCARRQATPYRLSRSDEKCVDDDGEEGNFSGEEQNDGEEDEEWEETEEYGECEDLCKSFSGMWVHEEEGNYTKKGLPHGEGKHIRFLYDSDGEDIEDEHVAREEAAAAGAVHLRGLPVPEGRHMRFSHGEEEEFGLET